MEVYTEPYFWLFWGWIFPYISLAMDGLKRPLQHHIILRFPPPKVQNYHKKAPAPSVVLLRLYPLRFIVAFLLNHHGGVARNVSVCLIPLMAIPFCGVGKEELILDG